MPERIGAVRAGAQLEVDQPHLLGQLGVRVGELVGDALNRLVEAEAGFHADHDYQVTDTLRFVQLTPPDSACSIVVGTGVTEMAPGSQKGVQVVVADVVAAREKPLAHGGRASDVDVQPWGSLVTFTDHDGNTWALQQLPPRPLQAARPALLLLRRSRPAA